MFTSDIVNNLLVGVLSKLLIENGGYQGFFLVLAGFGLLGLAITCLFPRQPEPGPRPVPPSPECGAGAGQEVLVEQEIGEKEPLAPQMVKD